MPSSDRKALKRKRILGIASLVAVLGIFCLLSYFVVYKFFSGDRSADGFTEFIESYGWAGRFVALGIQFLQVFVAIIPGEFVEVGLGLAFGAIEGSIICFIGVGLASALIFTLAKIWGVKLVELFVERKRIDELRIINSEKKLNTLVFILFLVPGTPKDLLTYVVPLTRMKLSEFMFISMIARIPSVLSSTIGGDFFSKGKYIEGIILFAVTGAVSFIGLMVYKKLLAKYHKHKEKKSS